MFLHGSIKKSRPCGRLFFLSICERLTLLDSASGAGASAGTAANASVLVDLVDVAFADSSDGALIDAGAASNTDVSDFVSHFVSFFRINIAIFLL